MSPRAPDIGPLEMEVMGLLDRRGKPASVADIRKGLGKELAYTTVMTVLVRLHRKGMVERIREGRQYLYSPAASFAKVRHSLLDRVRRSLFQRERPKPLVALLEGDRDLSVEELRELREMIDRRIEASERKK